MRTADGGERPGARDAGQLCEPLAQGDRQSGQPMTLLGRQHEPLDHDEPVRPGRLDLALVSGIDPGHQRK